MNSSTTPSGSSSGAESLQVYGLPNFQAALARYRPEAELLFCIVTYSPFLVATLSYSSSKVARTRGYPYLMMLAHIFSSLLMVIRYHARYAGLRAWPAPDTTDLVLFPLFALTSFHLQAVRAKTQPVVFRAGFHAAILMHASVFAASWMKGGDPALFRASIKFLNWFAWFRLTGQYVLPFVDPRLKSMKNFAVKYEVNVILSGSLALWEAGFPFGIPIQLGLVSVFMVMERAVAEIVSSYADDSLLKRFVLASGYVDFNHLKEKAGQSADWKVVEGGGTQAKL